MQCQITSISGVTALLTSGTASRRRYVEKVRSSNGNGRGFDDIHESRYALINMDGSVHRGVKDAVSFAVSECSDRALRHSRGKIEMLIEQNAPQQQWEMMRSVVVPSAGALVAHLVAGEGTAQKELEELLVVQYFTEGETEARVVFDRMSRLVEELVSDHSSGSRGIVPVLIDAGIDTDLLHVNLMAFLTAGATNIAAVSGSVIAELFNSVDRTGLVQDIAAVLRRIPFQRECFPRSLIDDMEIDGLLYRADSDVAFSADAADRELDRNAEGAPRRTSPVDVQTFKFGIGAHRCPADSVSRAFLVSLASALIHAFPDWQTGRTKVREIDSIHRPTELMLTSADATHD